MTAFQKGSPIAWPPLSMDRLQRGPSLGASTDAAIERLLSKAKANLQPKQLDKRGDFGPPPMDKLYRRCSPDGNKATRVSSPAAVASEAAIKLRPETQAALAKANVAIETYALAQRQNDRLATAKAREGLELAKGELEQELAAEKALGAMRMAMTKPMRIA